ncbi:MAG: hypothetical protein J6J41_09220, partial [Clostridia bacterium]|nr:hypothetical protein [Clostridia bacterium]
AAAKTTAAKKTTAAAKTTAAKKTTAAAKTTTAKKTTTAAKKTPATGTSMKMTAAEKKLVETYREATGDQKKTALKVLKGEYSEKALSLLNMAGGTGDLVSGVGGGIGDTLGDTLGNLVGSLLGGK